MGNTKYIVSLSEKMYNALNVGDVIKVHKGYTLFFTQGYKKAAEELLEIVPRGSTVVG